MTIPTTAPEMPTDLPPGRVVMRYSVKWSEELPWAYYDSPTLEAFRWMMTGPFVAERFSAVIRIINPLPDGGVETKFLESIYDPDTNTWGEWK